MRFLAEFAASFLVGWVVWIDLGLVFDWAFKDIAFLSFVALLMIFWAVAIRAKEGPTPFSLRLPFIVFALVPLLIVAVKLPAVFPLSKRLPARAFHNASLAEVLQYISEQQSKVPYWRFLVFDEEAVRTPITMTLPDDCTLREALDSVCRSVNCTYDWGWKPGPAMCPPSCATYCLHRKGSELDYGADEFLWVQGSHVWVKEEVSGEEGGGVGN